MQIKIARPSDPKSYEITPETSYWSRREWLAALGYTGAGLALAMGAGTTTAKSASPWEQQLLQKLETAKRDAAPRKEELTPYEDVTRYNNFYEFGTDKGDPVANSRHFKVEPWSVKIDGAVKKPFTLQLEDLLKPHALQERVYRFRCVEAWSMVVPWFGFPLAELIARC